PSLPRWRPLLVLASTGVFVLALWAVWHWQNTPAPPADDEPPAFVSPYLNTQPGVRYVGDRVCADCHSEGKTYKHHPMGRSAALLGRATPREASGKDGEGTFEALGSLFTVQRRGGKVLHKETYRAQGRVLGELEAEPSIVIGSGRQAISYLINR